MADEAGARGPLVRRFQYVSDAMRADHPMIDA
ncbi:hypothetical protein B1M_35151 [Burkholderia sp. TJI49]|nr:hypothetical protein B1M_35151 [Burkholderia sp. TJI49]